MSAKTKIQEQQNAQQQEALISEKLRFSAKRFKRFSEVILLLYNREDLGQYFADRRIAKIHECFGQVSPECRNKERILLKDTLIHLEKYSLLVSGEDYIQVVFNMVKFSMHWRKNVFEWKPSSRRGFIQLNELAFYLFCQYTVPEFLYKAFFEKSNRVFIHWFIHIGTGKKIKELPSMPLSFTQKMGHYFLQAPSRLGVTEALRWAQVKGMGGNDALAERIAFSWMGSKPYGDEPFWETFIRILISGGMFDHEVITGLIDYVRDTKRQNAGYNLKGRTLSSLLKQSEEWHKRASYMKDNQVWNSCGLYSYKAEITQGKVVMEELTAAQLLADEGRTMKHCVATYTPYCVNGKTAIFSLRKYEFGLVDILATIEVNLATKTVMQAKAKLNRKINEEATKHLTAWAKKNGLMVNPFL